MQYSRTKIGLWLLTLGATWISWQYMATILSSGPAALGWFEWCLFFLILILSLNGLALSLLFNRNPVFIVGFALVCGLPIIILWPHSWLLWLGLSLWVGTWFYGNHALHTYLNHRHTFSYWQTARQGIGKLMLGLAVLAAVNIYIVTAHNIHQNPDLLYAKMAQVTTDGLTPLLKLKLGDFDENTSVADLVSNSHFLDRYTVPVDSENGATDSSVLNILGIEVNSEDKAEEVLERMVYLNIKTVFEPIRMFIPLIYALLLLLSLRVFIPVLAALVAGVGSGIFKLLTWSGRLTLETRVEEVEYPVWH